GSRPGAGARGPPRAPGRRVGALARGRRARVFLEQPQGDTDASREGVRAENMSKKRGLTVVTYNIHKGLSQFNKRLVLHGIKEGLKTLDADVAFLQEVQ